MFRSIKLPDKRVIGFALVCVIVFSVVCAVMLRAGTPDTIMIDGEKFSLSADSADEAGAFLEALGYTPALFAKRQITVPSSWNAQYASFDEMQRSCGLGLDGYRGREATLYQYTLDGKDGVAEVTVCGGRIVAADLCRGSKTYTLFVKGE